MKFDEAQKEYWESVKNARFDWQTQHPLIREWNRRLIVYVDALPGVSVLEVGCGEGANLLYLSSKWKKVGVDFSGSLIATAKKKFNNTKFFCEDATMLHFRDGPFDVVFCRDLIHHVSQRGKVIQEMFRVCKKGGRVVLIESNGRNPLTFVYSLVRPVERDLCKMSGEYFRSLLSGRRIVEWAYEEPFPWWRFVFHYQFGFPKLGRYKLVRRFCAAAEYVLRVAVPKSFWAYFVIVMEK